MMIRCLTKMSSVDLFLLLFIPTVILILVYQNKTTLPVLIKQTSINTKIVNIFPKIGAKHFCYRFGNFTMICLIKNLQCCFIIYKLEL